MERNKLKYKSAVQFLHSLIKPHKKYYLLAVAISTILVVIGIVQTKVSQVLIDSSISKNLNSIIKSIIILILLILIDVVFRYISGISVSKLSTSAGKDLKHKIAHILIFTSYKEIINTKSGDVLKTVNIDIQNICTFIENNMINLISQFSLALGAIIYLIYINPKLTFITFLYTPIGMFFTLNLNKKMGNLYQIEADKGGKALSFAEQALTQIPVIKSFVMEKNLRNKLHSMYADIGKTEKNISIWNALIQTACSSTSYGPKIIYLIYAGNLVINDNMSIGSFIAIYEMLNYIIGPSVYFPFLLNGFNRTIASINRVEIVNQMKVETNESKDENKSDIKEKYIKFKNVSFGYDDKKVINNLSFSYTANGIIALCGKSGSGKTTILDLIYGLYKQNDGEINVSSDCVVVTQDAYIFVDTLYNNVHMANPNATYENVIYAMHCAGLDNLIDKLDEGVETKIGEGIRELSGGERQRVSLARAILKDLPIWLLDEPTSSLDEETETIILDVIKRKSIERLIVISAHRQSLIDMADRRVNLNEI